MTYLVIAAVAYMMWKNGVFGGQKKPPAPLISQTPIQQFPVYQAAEAVPVVTFSDLILQEAQRRKDEAKRQAELDAAVALLLKEKKDAA